jgi:hypothetical protein
MMSLKGYNLERGRSIRGLVVFDQVETCPLTIEF